MRKKKAEQPQIYFNVAERIRKPYRRFEILSGALEEAERITSTQDGKIIYTVSIVGISESKKKLDTTGADK